MKSTLKNFATETKAFLVPVLSIIATVLILSVPRDNSYWNFLRQAPFYIGIYFWQSQRADIFNIFSTFILGLFADVLGSTFLGVNILTFLLLYIISAQLSKRFNIQRFSYSWLLFATACIITFLFKTLIVSILYRQIISLNMLSIEYLLTIALYPLLTRIYIWVERKFIHLEERYEKVER